MGNFLSANETISQNVLEQYNTEDFTETAPLNKINTDSSNLLNILKNMEEEQQANKLINLIGGFESEIDNNLTTSESSPFIKEDMNKYLSQQEGGSLEEDSSTNFTSSTNSKKKLKKSKSNLSSSERNYNSYISSEALSNSSSFNETTISENFNIPDSVNTSEINMISIDH